MHTSLVFSYKAHHDAIAQRASSCSAAFSEADQKSREMRISSEPEPALSQAQAQSAGRTGPQAHWRPCVAGPWPSLVLEKPPRALGRHRRLLHSRCQSRRLSRRQWRTGCCNMILLPMTAKSCSRHRSRGSHLSNPLIYLPHWHTRLVPLDRFPLPYPRRGTPGSRQDRCLPSSASTRTLLDKLPPAALLVLRRQPAHLAEVLDCATGGPGRRALTWREVAGAGAGAEAVALLAGRPRAGSVRARPVGPTGRAGLWRAAVSVLDMSETGVSAGALRPAQARRFGTATGIDSVIMPERAGNRYQHWPCYWELCQESVTALCHRPESQIRGIPSLVANFNDAELVRRLRPG
jgi:hypothetical protein